MERNSLYPSFFYYGDGTPNPKAGDGGQRARPRPQTAGPRPNRRAGPAPRGGTRFPFGETASSSYGCRRRLLRNPLVPLRRAIPGVPERQRRRRGQWNDPRLNPCPPIRGLSWAPCALTRAPPCSTTRRVPLQRQALEAGAPTIDRCSRGTRRRANAFRKTCIPSDPVGSVVMEGARPRS